MEWVLLATQGGITVRRLNGYRLILLRSGESGPFNPFELAFNFKLLHQLLTDVDHR